MDKQLRQFYNDEHTRLAVQAFLVEVLAQEAIQRVMERKDVSHLADANDIIEKAFIKLKETFGEEPKPSHTSSR